MALDTSDREWIQREIRKAQEEALGRRGLPWFRDWIIVGASAVIVLGSIIAVIVLTNFAMRARKHVADAQTILEDRAANLDRELDAVTGGIAAIIASNEASRPDFPERLPNLLLQNAQRAEQNLDPIVSTETAAALVRKARAMSVRSDPTHIAEIGLDFMRLVKTERLTGPVMQAAEELIGYRSFLVPNPFGEADRSAVAHSAMLTLPQFHSFKPLTSKSGIFGYRKLSLKMEVPNPTAGLNLLSRPEAMLADPFAAVLVDGYEVQLDGLDVRNAVFSGCRIRYDGGKIKLENIYFHDCTFSLDRAAVDFARVALDVSPAVLYSQR